jgi:single-strand DNA-binding protein
MSTPVYLVGRIGNDPEVTFGKSGTAVVKFRVVTSGRKQVDGKWEDVDTSWWNVTAFRQLAENLAESVNKGDTVIVVGRIKQRNYETPDGEKRSVVEVLAESVGPDLRWAVAQVKKAERVGRQQFADAKAAIEDDPWTTRTDDQPPF